MRVDERKTVAAYGYLLGLYPRTFRERMGESMLQTFRDLCREQRSAIGYIPIGFLLSTFAETSAGVFKERILDVIVTVMNNAFLRISVSVLIGLVATLPFVVTEYIYSGGYPAGIPFAIFNVLWLEASIFTYLAISLFRTPRTGPVSDWIFPLLLKSLGLVIIMSSWTFVVADQLPCFLGGKGC
ncbi:MAG: hypothetical protein IPN69_04280 [Acidobacteria bacterium]|nr:hypothetical protein [Acidobacteriota bacterium]